jgi:hypothetical protein
MVLKLEKGTPTSEGFWAIKPNKGHWLNDSTAVRVRQVSMVSAYGKEQLYIHGYPDDEHKLEAYLFEGKVAGPIEIKE